MPVLNVEALIENRVEAIRAFHLQTGQTRAELDLSGGVDSAVMLGLLSRALGPENVSAVFLGIHSSPDAQARARDCAATFGVKLIEFDGTAIYGSFMNEMLHAMTQAGYSQQEILARCENDKTVMGSIRSTMRAPWGRAVNRLSGGGIRHGTGNEDEDRVLRFYQKGGDGEVDSNPISMLSKGEVFQLGIALGVPRSILTARPSPDLWGVGDAHNDEEEIAAYLGLSGCGIPFYSYVDVGTGQYKNVGLIERLHRWLDKECSFKRPYTNEAVFFHGDGGVEDGTLISEAIWEDPFRDVPSGVVGILLTNARRVEKATRHKMNPNCPSLGDRAVLVAKGILTNELPL